MRHSLSLLLMLLPLLVSVTHAAVTVDRQSVAALQIVADDAGLSGIDARALTEAVNLLSTSLERHLGTAPTQVKIASEKPAIILAHVSKHPDLKTQLPADDLDAFAIVTRNEKVYVLGASMTAVRHGVATLLHELGYRFYNPSPTWWITPRASQLNIDLNLTSAPALRGRSIWYAYGSGSARLQSNYQVWANANRLGSASPVQSGHSYGQIIQRNQKVFDAHPEFFAMNAAGERQNKLSPMASKFCFSNPQLQALVAADRLNLLRENQRENPQAFMVSVDPSDGRGTCHCKPCQALGTPTDRVLTLANHVARHLRQQDPKAWVGMYAYSSHREPPTITAEPNVYVQVAVGFNRTSLSVPELVTQWSQRVGAVGLREYYGVEAWDWGLPGRLRGGQIDYHTQWIPYYAARKINAVNAETNANWAAQTPGNFIAAQLMWNPTTKAQPLVDEFFTVCFAKAAPIMRRLYQRFDLGPQLEPAVLRAMCDDLAEAYDAETEPTVRARVVDLMAYVHYIALFREFSLEWDAEPKRGDAYYAALLPLLEFSHRIAERDMIHCQALVRRLVNSLPLTDGRFEFWFALSPTKRPPPELLAKFGKADKDLPRAPVWMSGEPCSDEQVRQLFAQTQKALANDQRREVFFSRFLDYASAPGPDAGSSRAPSGAQGAVQLHGETTVWLATDDDAQIPLQITPVNGPVEITSLASNDVTIEQFTVTDTSKPTPVTLRFERANDYRVRLRGAMELTTEPATPLVIEASRQSPATIRHSGPLYFYVPRGVSEIVLRVNGTAVLHVPRQGVQRVDGSGQQQIIAVPTQAAGTLWHFTSDTDATIALINVPPLLHLHRDMVLSVREVSQSDGLTTMTQQQTEASRWKP